MSDQAGAFDYIAEEDLALELVVSVATQCEQWVGAQTLPRITMHRLLYDRMEGDSFKITGPCPAFETITVDPSGAADDEVTDEVVAPALEDGIPEDVEEDGNFIDMMDAFDVEKEPRERRPKQTKKQKAASEAEVKAIEDIESVAKALGFDPGDVHHCPELEEIFGLLKADAGDAAAAQEEDEELDMVGDDAGTSAAAVSGTAVVVEAPAPPAPFVMDQHPDEFCNSLGMDAGKGWSYLLRETGRKVGGLYQAIRNHSVSSGFGKLN